MAQYILHKTQGAVYRTDLVDPSVRFGSAQAPRFSFLRLGLHVLDCSAVGNYYVQVEITLGCSS